MCVILDRVLASRSHRRHDLSLLLDISPLNRKPVILIPAEGFDLQSNLKICENYCIRTGSVLVIQIQAKEQRSQMANTVTGDSGPGTGFADLLPVPPGSEVVTDPDHQETSNTLADDITLSHSLATGDHSNKGRAQVEHEDPEVLDLGWNEEKQNIPRPLVGGMGNEELWMLIRRFNKVRLV